MITNPNKPAPVVDEDAPSGILRRKSIRLPDFDAVYDKMAGTIQAKIVDVDAKLIEQGQVKHYASLKEMLAAPSVKKRIQQAYTASTLREVADQVQELGNKTLREAGFNLGLYDDEPGLSDTKLFRVQDVVLPSLSSPYAKNALWSDYREAHARVFEAATRNPIGWRVVTIIPQFVLARGVVGTIRSSRHQSAWDDYWQRNGMKLRLKTQLRELLTYGEIFLRYFKTRDGLTVRSLDPITIWDIVTDPDDLETVQFYHQQYMVMNPSPVPGLIQTPAKLIIRQIPANDVDHFKINATSSEKRGRSILYSSLGWLARFKEFANDRVLLNKMRSMFALNVSVDGDATDLARAEDQFAEPPGSGSIFVHNKSVEIEYLNANTNANEAKTDGDFLLRVISIGTGVSEQFLGGSGASTRASALISTEPDVKNFETYQEIVEEILHKASRRVWAAGSLPQPRQDMEFTFPALSQEDRSMKLKDIAFAEAMDYFSKARSAAMAAKEFQITTYDFETEQKTIAAEKANNPVIATGMQQLPKIAPDPMAGAPGLGGDMTPGLGADMGAEAPSLPEDQQVEPQAQANLSGEMGMSPKNLSGRSAPNTQATLNRGNFTRGGEQAAITNQRTSGTPLRHSATDGPVMSARRGWTAAAREKSLRVRQERARRRREEQLTYAVDASRGTAGNGPGNDTPTE